MSVVKEGNKQASSQLVEMFEVKGTPFQIGKVNDRKEKKYFIAIGSNRLTEYIDRSEAEMQIKTKSWDLMLRLTALLVERTVKLELSRKEVKETK